MTRVYAIREHDKTRNKIQDYIVIRSEDSSIYINIPIEKIKEALEQFETGEELHINY